MVHLDRVFALVAMLAVLGAAANTTAPDTTHMEGKNTTSIDPADLTCPINFIAGIGTGRYCFHCGEMVQLGCGGACGPNQSCSPYAQDVCGPLSNDYRSFRSNCTDTPSSTEIFPSSSNGTKPDYCYQGGKKKELESQFFGTSYSKGNNPVLFSDACGFLLNNCPGGVFQNATIYNMDPSAGNDPSKGNTIYTADFTGYATFAIKFTQSNTC